MVTPQLPQKVVFMGLGASGKSSIRSVVFEGKTPQELKDYEATINYTRSTKNIINSTFQIFDCGGQESFISAFIGDQAEFIFSDVSILVWVVDISDFDQVSTSKFYFNHAITRLYEYSPDGVVFCLLHKRDLISPDKQDQALATMKQYLTTDLSLPIHYHTTSIFDQSIYHIMGELIRTLVQKTDKAKTVSEAIQEFLGQNNEVSGIAIYTEDGVPVFEEGRLAN
ncbi:MAG: ADP-ribosylation factor-like protein, partial [Candidatus Kariarchaeaceae archaeon]